MFCLKSCQGAFINTSSYRGFKSLIHKLYSLQQWKFEETDVNQRYKNAYTFTPSGNTTWSFQVSYPGSIEYWPVKKFDPAPNGRCHFGTGELSACLSYKSHLLLLFFYTELKVYYIPRVQIKCIVYTVAYINITIRTHIAISHDNT